MRREYYTYHIQIDSYERIRVDKLNTQRQSMGGDRREFRFLEKREELASMLGVIESDQLNNSDEARKIGEVLFDILFDEVLCRDFLNFFQQVIREENQFLRLELDIDEQGLPDIAVLPWEFMCLPERGDLPPMWICTEPKLVFSRRRVQWIPTRKIQVNRNEKLRIALMVSTPSDLTEVVYKPVKDVLEELAKNKPDKIELLPIETSASPEAIDRVVSKKPHIFHFIGHGKLEDKNSRKVGKIALVDDIGTADWVDETYFSSLFSENPPNVLMLQVCEGAMQSASKAFVGVASKCHQQSIPVIVAMQYEVSNSTAKRFALRFYRKLAEGDPIDIAAQYGRRGIALGPTQYRKRDFATPVIFMRAQDGYLFDDSEPNPRQSKLNSVFDFPLQDLDPNLQPLPVSSLNSSDSVSQSNFKDNIVRNLPSSGSDQFTDREEELTLLHQQLQESHRGTITAITGMGGVGKTEFALQYALRHKLHYNGGTCWFQVKGTDLGVQIIQFGRLHLNLNPPQELDIPTQLSFCWLHWPMGEVLMVLDDVVTYEQVKSYLPPSTETRFKVLITTRFWLSETVQAFRLDVLTEEAALALLKAQIGLERVQGELESAKQLCTWLKFLPVSLKLVGAHLAVGGVQSWSQRKIAKQGIEPAIHPSDPQMQQMIESVFTPAHPSALKALCNQPFTSTLDHPRTNRIP